MESNKNKDIIDHIVRSLRDKEELPYREGAWEKFQSTQFAPKRTKAAYYYWAASAAAALLIAFFAVNRWSEAPIGDHTLTSNDSNPTEQTTVLPELNDSPAETPHDLSAANSLSSGVITAQSTGNLIGSNSSNTNKYTVGDLQLGSLQAAHVAFAPSMMNIPTLKAEGVEVRSVVNLTNTKPVRSGNIEHSMAYQAGQFAMQADWKEPKIGQKKFSFSEKFDLGLFVSPSSTNEQMNFGGGMLLGYNISKNLSVRTGLAYNQYEVGLMKDPIGAPETQVLATSDVLEHDAKYSMVATQASRTMVLPNVNAVSGNVQAFEIPLEVKYKTNAGLYASTGMTYAVVLNQNRYTHFIENANADLFEKGLPTTSKEMNDAVQPVTRKVKTDEENVNTNNFGGFVNFSIGKEMRVNKRLNLSVEPYVKLPVGSFKRADMNYTNGGIRIITNF